MRIRLVASVVTVTVACGAAVAVAAHPQVDPASVPTGFLTAHSLIDNVSASEFEKALDSGKTDVFIEHGRLAANGTTGFQTTPGPVLVTVQSGSLRFEESKSGQCRRKTYSKGQGVAVRTGKAHRLVGGSAGVDYYAVSLLPRKTGPNRTASSAPQGC